MLFAIWTGEMHRPTPDLDLLGFGDAGQGRLREVFETLCGAPVDDDGLVFRKESVIVEAIREDQEYSGQRVTLEAPLGQARIDLQVDVGFGDAITPSAELVEYPTLLGMQPPKIRAYPKETVVAEKLEAMVKLGMANSRMKDFYDLFLLARSFAFDGETLRRAIAATFDRRGTSAPEAPPAGLTDDFAKDGGKAKQWKAFRSRSGLEDKAGDLNAVVQGLAAFLLPPLHAVGERGSFQASWTPNGPWVVDG